MDDILTAGQSGDAGTRVFSLCFVCVFLVVLIFSMDMAIPLGVAMGVPYLVAVLIALKSPGKKLTVIITVICSLLTIGAFLYKPAVAEMWKAVFNRAIALFSIWVTAILGLQKKNIEEKQDAALRQREKALEEVRILSGLLPICSSCKKIRDDKGYWTQIEFYIKEHSEADFTHGICPECTKELYPEFYEKKYGSGKGSEI
ncbi:hypothetical protein [Desulforegula conservatrix]|uniref:hypothetical protein n=1 Tax=Desulforegula conservatrix TaxID=153026 RepID=UPI0004141253|nr:hypothetical protein [Desulforegula conservatrix]